MALLLTEADVRAILTLPMAMELTEESFRRLASGSGVSHPRRRLKLAEKGLMHYMAAADSEGGYVGLKIYTVSPSGLRFLVPLFSGHTGELVALIEANRLGQARTGAATGVATKFLAREDARVAAMIGSGFQAQTQLEAVALARKLDLVRVYSRDAARREAFAKDMAAKIGVRVAAVGSAEEAVRGADIVTTMTNSTKPVLLGKWLERGTHVNAAGVNFAEKAEIDAETVERADLIAADSVEQSKMEAGDLIQAFARDLKRWDEVREFSGIVAGKIPGRTNRDQITLFKSNGIAMEDVVVAGRVYELARERRMGREVPMFAESSGGG
jgi:ornithine cyclodeaminase/alanine dehydrogenase-like protein (mu-crystallin family)